jgi:CHAT domain-containing protein
VRSLHRFHRRLGVLLATAGWIVIGVPPQSAPIDHVSAAPIRPAGIEAVGQDSLSEAHALDTYVAGSLKSGNVASPDALAAAERAVRLKEQQLGPSHPDTAVSLSNLGVLHAERGMFSIAVPLLEQVHSIRAQSDGQVSDGVADARDMLGSVLTGAARYKEAEEHLAAARRLREQLGDAGSAGLADTARAFGVLYRWTGRYKEALVELDRAAEIEANLAPDDLAIALTLLTRGDVQHLMGDPFAARETWRTALTHLERARVDHPRRAHILRRLGSAAFAIGDLAEARRLRQNALDVGTVALPPCHPETHGLSNDRANSARADGDYQVARRLYAERVAQMDTCRRLSAADVPEDGYATLALNQGALASEMGEHHEAATFYQRAADIWSRELGEDHPFVGQALDNLASTYEARNQFTRANVLRQRALSIRQKSLGATHPNTARTLVNLARGVSAAGRPGEATKYLSEAVAIYRSGTSSAQPDGFASALSLQGAMAMQQGDFVSARTAYAEAAVVSEKMFAAGHPSVAQARAALATTDLALGSHSMAAAAALETERAARDVLVSTIKYLPERQALSYIQNRPRGVDLALSVLAVAPNLETGGTFDAVVRSRGVILGELAGRSRTAAQPQPGLAPLVERLTNVRQRYANLIIRALQSEQSVSRAMLERTLREKEEAERALAEESAALRDELARASAGLDDVRRHLPERAALASFVRFDRTSFVERQGRRVREVAPAYMAFIMSSGSDRVDVVPLGAAVAMEKSVAGWQQHARGTALKAGDPLAEQAYRQAGLNLRRQAWDRIVPHLNGAERVFVVADGSLNLVNFAALPDDRGGYLVESGPLVHYLSAERDLVPTESSAPARGLLAIGGPAFDGPASARQPATSRQSGCGTLQQLRFTSLPGTLAEAREITAAWSIDGGDTALLTGSAASEAAVKRQMPGRRIVHLATHGFFLGDDCAPPRPPQTRAVGGFAAAPAPRTPATDNPLLLSGLALAGANTRTTASISQDDGILTAEEVAGLNLQGTEWAVLSACDTGVGAIRAGEGVFGLRRAFEIAGARTVIMSLWSVDDQATRTWMRSLYERRLSGKLETDQAVRAASLGLLRERRARGQSTHPFYWGAFVAVGDWR